MSSDPAAGSRLPGVLRRPLATGLPRLWAAGGNEPGRCFWQAPAAPFPPARSTTPSCCLRICLCPSEHGAGGAGARGRGSARGWRLRPALPPGPQRAAAAEKDAATLSPVSTSHSFHWRVKISNFFFYKAGVALKLASPTGFSFITPPPPPAPFLLIFFILFYYFVVIVQRVRALFSLFISFFFFFFFPPPSFRSFLF